MEGENMSEHIMDTGIDALLCSELQVPAPYFAKVIGKVDNGNGYWKYCRIGIFQRALDIKIGEYTYEYPHPAQTFHPFKLRNNWYALYSSDYTATRLMSLPDCKDIGGEEGNAAGFCPMEYFVPGLHYIQTIHDEGCPRDYLHGHAPDYKKACSCTVIHNINCRFNPQSTATNQSCICHDEAELFNTTHTIWHFPDRIHGFVAGCQWGDDSSLKIQYLDLSQADKGILKREERFGYIQLPSHLSLSQAVDLDCDGEEKIDDYSLRISTMNYYDFKTGKLSE
jgi:hypothetical protein